MRRLITGIGLLFPAFLSAQNFESALNNFAAKNQPEKIYIHYDKDYYVTGETIWFKAYFYNEGKPSPNNNNLFLQFTDSKGKVVSRKSFPVMGAVAKGSIVIPDSLPQGNYYIRALSPVMLNQEEPFIYKKNIFIFKPATAAKTVAETKTLSLQFFPESGNMVDGIVSVVAFKANDQYGNPMNVNGTIRLEDGTNITSFKTYHDGIGKMQFRPQSGKKYIAEVETDAGKRTFALPEVKPSGIILKIQDEKGGKKFELARGNKDKALFETVTIVADINHHLVYETEVKFEDYPSIIGHIVTDSLPSGILHFTVFNKDGLPLAERLSFVNNREYAASADLASIQTSTERRAENNLELNFPELLQRSLSIAVTDLSGNSLNDDDNIWSRFLLTSDLKGYVHNPAWYFTQTGDSVKQALDNLMLTHGWSRFNWTKVLAGEIPAPKFQDQPLISITGKVVEPNSKAAVPGGKLSIFMEAEDSSSRNLEAIVDDAGNFRLDSLIFGGKGEFFYVYADKKGKNKPALLILDENPLLGTVQSLPSGMLENTVARNVNTNASKSEIDTRHDFSKTNPGEVKELEQVTVEAKSGKKPVDVVNEKYTSGAFRTPGKVTLDNINEPANDRAMNAVDYIKNRVQQVEIQGNQFVNRKNMSLMTGQKWPVGIFINEGAATIFQLRLLRTDDIALVKFFEAGFVGVGSSFPGGAIAVYTKEQTAPENKPDKLDFVTYNGYSISKEFYNPDYSNKDIKQPATDNRTTLYWNPDVYTDTETKTVKLKFFNNDFSKKLKVVVEGFDAAGKLVHIEKIIGN